MQRSANAAVALPLADSLDAPTREVPSDPKTSEPPAALSTSPLANAEPLPLDPSPDDIEAAARLIASENPSASDQVKIEQIWTQIRSTKRGQTLFQRITAGKGYGNQGGSRPVATTHAASPADRELAARVLRGELQSSLPGARKFFDPAEQDKVFRQVQRAKADVAAGRAISERDQKLIAAGYKRDAQGVRDKWSSEGSHLVGAVPPVEFWT